MGLHREFMWKGISGINKELRRRAWWALEVFDKYAAIPFGRPCTIDESDCSTDPAVDIRLDGEMGSHQKPLLEYHRQKFELYRLMDPFLGRRSQTGRLETVNNLHSQLLLWKSRLPDSLCLHTYKANVPSDKPPLCQLQALALQLAYDNLHIILHRSVAFGASCHDIPYGGNTAHGQGLSLNREELLQSALRTSELGHYSHIHQACRRTHAVMHVSICLFTAGVVLCAICLSGPLSPSSQKAKAGIMAIIHLHRKSFPGQHLLSAQSAKILEDAVAAVMQHEQQLILGNPPPRSIGDQRWSSNEEVVTTTEQKGSQIPGVSQAEEKEALLAPLQEVFAHHLQDGARRAGPPTNAMDEQIPPNLASSFEESPIMGHPSFSWDGYLYSMIDPDLADANQMWLWSDSTLQG
ncbi:fungal transcription factor regulatory middle homology region [Aspergillus lentulus]|nr:fungal transcription factor regulatory middle homology region [Aspergillus lentulus]